MAARTRGRTEVATFLLTLVTAAATIGCGPGDRPGLRHAAGRRRPVPRGARVTPGRDPLRASADSIRTAFGPVTCDTVLLRTGYTASDPEGAVTPTIGCAAGTNNAHAYVFTALSSGRTLVTGRLTRALSDGAESMADSVARALDARDGPALTCPDSLWPAQSTARVWRETDGSARVVVDGSTGDVSVERSLAAPDCDPSLFASYPVFPYR